VSIPRWTEDKILWTRAETNYATPQEAEYETKFDQEKLPLKLPDYFFSSNKSNIKTKQNMKDGIGTLMNDDLQVNYQLIRS